MTTLIFVLVWVVLGLALLLIAFSGGPSGAMQQVMSQTRGARKLAIVLFSLLALALGVLIPAAVIAAVSNRDDIPEANVTDLTEPEKNGRELFGQRCANCHTLKAANAIAAVGPNLDELRPTKDLVLNAIDNGRANGNGRRRGRQRRRIGRRRGRVRRRRWRVRRRRGRVRRRRVVGLTALPASCTVVGQAVRTKC